MSRLRFDAATRRAQILDEALREIGEKGYRGFTIQGLAGRCGLTNAGLLHYFGSKDKLLLALLDEMGLREELAIEPLLLLAAADASSSSMSYAAMIAVLRTLAERVERVPELARFAAVLQTESLEETHPAHEWFADREREARLARLAAEHNARQRAERANRDR